MISILCSCQTIRFVKSDKAIANANKESLGLASKMHHIGILGLYEYSSPASIKSTCGKDFVFVETYWGFKEWLIRSVGGFGTGGLIGLIWTPHSLDIACQETDTDRQIASINSEDEFLNEEFRFKVLKIKDRKIFIKFLDEIPTSKTFKIVHDDYRGLAKIQKRINSKALIFAEGIKLKKNSIYKGR